MIKLLCIGLILLLLIGGLGFAWWTMRDALPVEERHYSFTNITPGEERVPCICGLVVVIVLAVGYILLHADKIDKVQRIGGDE